MGLSKNAPVRVTAREREISALRLRAEGCTYEEIGRRLGVAKQSAWEAVDRAMTRSADELRERGAEVRALEAERLDAAAAAIWPKVMDGDLRAQETWLRNRTRYSSLVGLDVRHESAVFTDDRLVNIITAPPWERGAASGRSETGAQLSLPPGHAGNVSSANPPGRPGPETKETTPI